MSFYVFFHIATHRDIFLIYVFIHLFEYNNLID